MTPIEYLGNIIFWITLILLVYLNVFYVALPGIPVEWSTMIFCAIMLALPTIGWLVARRRMRNNLSLAVNVVLPYEVYTVLAYHTYMPWLI